MKKQFQLAKALTTATALTIAAGTASAGGLDRSGTPIDALFEKGNYAEFSLGFTMPDVTGNDVLANNYSNVGGDFSVYGAALKMDINDRLSFALIVDQPYGADILYGGNPATTMLGGTAADAESMALTALLRYKFTDRISAYGGPRVVEAEGNITLSGLAYGRLSGYNVNFASDHGYGYVVGAAYEITEIALRAALTYHSSVDLEFTTTDSFATPAAKTKSEMPEVIELAVQSGISQNTLLFASVRWSKWQAFALDPPNLLVPNLSELDNTTAYELGIGRRFSEKFSASVAVSYETGGSDSLVSPLAPTNGQSALTIAGKYKISDMVTLSGGIRYTWLGNGLPETGTPDVQRGTFSNNNAVSAGLKLGFHF